MNKVSNFGYDFSAFSSEERAVDYIFTGDIGESNPVVATINLDQLVKFEAEAALKEFVQKSFVIVADGMPVVAASRIYGRPITKRISGADLFPLFWERARRSNEKVLCVTPSDDVSKALRVSFPEASYWTPEFFDGRQPDALEKTGKEFIEQIHLSNARYVVIGIGLPNRELLAQYAISSIGRGESPKLLLFGAAFEFYIGEKKRAPKFVQNIGLEWLHRFLSEPNRLFRRYFVDSFGFIKIFIRYFRKG